MSEFNYRKLKCISCEVAAIELVSRATWVCKNCGRDNSLYVVMVHQAIEHQPSVRANSKLKRKLAKLAPKSSKGEKE